MIFLRILFILCISYSYVYAIEWVYPVGDPNQRTVRVTQEYMIRNDSKNFYDDQVHLGVDIGRGRIGNINYTPNNKTVRSVAKGRVIYLQTGYNSGWGNTIVIRHDFLCSNRYVFSSYSHLANDSIKVEYDEVVQPGQVLGIMGNTGTGDGGNNNLPSDYKDGYHYTHGETTFYDPLLFIKFARLAVISPPSVQSYSVNSDKSESNPSAIKVGNNNVEVTVTTYRNEISMYLELRNYSGSYIGGEMSIKDKDYSGWIMSDQYSPLGNDCNNNGWNCERKLTYTYDFNVKTNDTSGIDIGVFWKPFWYESSSLILPIPGGVAHNTIRNTGRYVHRPVE